VWPLWPLGEICAIASVRSGDSRDLLDSDSTTPDDLKPEIAAGAASTG
jgi:hypothetical protein